MNVADIPDGAWFCPECVSSGRTDPVMSRAANVAAQTMRRPTGQRNMNVPGAWQQQQQQQQQLLQNAGMATAYGGRGAGMSPPKMFGGRTSQVH